MSQEQREQLAPLRTLRLKNTEDPESTGSFNIIRSRKSASHLADDLGSGHCSLLPSSSTPARRIFLKRESLIGSNPFLDLNRIEKRSESNSDSLKDSPRRHALGLANELGDLNDHRLSGDEIMEPTEFGDILRKSSMLHFNSGPVRSRFRVRSSIFGDFGLKKRGLSDFLGDVKEDKEDDHWMARAVLDPKKKEKNGLDKAAGKNSTGKNGKKRDSLNSKKSNKKR